MVSERESRQRARGRLIRAWTFARAQSTSLRARAVERHRARARISEDARRGWGDGGRQVDENGIRVRHRAVEQRVARPHVERVRRGVQQRRHCVERLRHVEAAAQAYLLLQPLQLGDGRHVELRELIKGLVDRRESLCAHGPAHGRDAARRVGRRVGEAHLEGQVARRIGVDSGHAPRCHVARLARVPHVDVDDRWRRVPRERGGGACGRRLLISVGAL